MCVCVCVCAYVSLNKLMPPSSKSPSPPRPLSRVAPEDKNSLNNELVVEVGARSDNNADADTRGNHVCNRCPIEKLEVMIRERDVHGNCSNGSFVLSSACFLPLARAHTHVLFFTRRRYISGVNACRPESNPMMIHLVVLPSNCFPLFLLSPFPPYPASFPLSSPSFFVLKYIRQ